MKRILTGLLFLIGVGLLGRIGWSALQPPATARHVAAPAPVAPQTVRIIVSAQGLHAGSLIRPQDLQARDFPADATVAGAMADSAAARAHLTGALLRVSIEAGGVLLPADFVFPGDHGYLAAVLTPGTRAISVGVDAVSGNAGLIWPGDRVDLILTQSLADPSVPVQKRMVAETVIGGIRVIATDQDLVRGELPASNGAATRTITLEASQEQAQRIAVASRMGQLSLSLCAVDGVARPSAVRAPLPIWSGDVSPALALGSAAEAPQAVKLFDGATDQKEFRF